MGTVSMLRANGSGNNQISTSIPRQSPIGYHQDLQDYRSHSRGVSNDDVKNLTPQDLASLNQSTNSLVPDTKSHNLPTVEAPSTRSGSEMPNILTKMVAATDEEGSKKKRGRPKKLILDPETNQYIDSSHENYKRLNRLLKENSSFPKTKPPNDQVGKLITKGTNFGSLNDQTVKQLLEQKDRRGRPRKFPIEQTGITIKGIRVNGTLKSRKRGPAAASPDQVTKKKRGRPRREQSSLP